MQAGFYLQPHLRRKQTTIYSNGGFTTEDVVLRDAANPGGRLHSVSPRLRRHAVARHQPHRRRGLRRLRAGFVAARVTPDGLGRPARRLHRQPRSAVRHRNLQRLEHRSADRRHLRPDRQPSPHRPRQLGTCLRHPERELSRHRRDRTARARATNTISISTARSKRCSRRRRARRSRRTARSIRIAIRDSSTNGSSAIACSCRGRRASTSATSIAPTRIVRRWSNRTASTTAASSSGYRDESFNEIYLVTNNQWNWFVYRGLELTANNAQAATGSSIPPTRSRISTSTARGSRTIRPRSSSPTRSPTMAASARCAATRRTASAAILRNRMWQKHQVRTGVTWSAPWDLILSTNLSIQSGTPTGPVTTNIAAADPRFGPATLRLSNGRLVSNPLATTLRFAYRGSRRRAAVDAVAEHVEYSRRPFVRAGVAGAVGLRGATLDASIDVFNVTNNGGRSAVRERRQSGQQRRTTDC